MRLFKAKVLPSIASSLVVLALYCAVTVHLVYETDSSCFIGLQVLRDQWKNHFHRYIEKFQPLFKPDGDNEDEEITKNRRTNFAASDAGAHVVEANPGAKYANSILSNEDDRYLINLCSEPKKWFIVSLSEDVQIDTFLLLSKEQYSSYIKHFELQGSVKYPSNEWFSLGNFTAKNTKNWQMFKMPKPAWVRYLKLSYKSQYDNEYYCTMTQIKVFGSTMLSTFRDDLKTYSGYMKNLSGTLLNQTITANVTLNRTILITNETIEEMPVPEIQIPKVVVNVKPNFEDENPVIYNNETDTWNGTETEVSYILEICPAKGFPYNKQNNEEDNSHAIMMYGEGMMGDFDPSESLFGRLTKHLSQLEASVIQLNTMMVKERVEVIELRNEVHTLQNNLNKHLDGLQNITSEYLRLKVEDVQLKKNFSRIKERWEKVERKQEMYNIILLTVLCIILITLICMGVCKKLLAPIEFMEKVKRDGRRRFNKLRSFRVIERREKDDSTKSTKDYDSPETST